MTVDPSEVLISHEAPGKTMRRAIAPLVAVGIVVAVSLFATFAPVVPSSAHSSKSGGSGCPAGVTFCVIAGPDV